ncbi:hypothetical protein HYPSUDRAFT_70607 [Hypholoma sublateritium FD-334 SS-4]|uniref:Rab-GAP TBC domain-containing protein n=1 Tax=Hypholoma sublateritium (strain FD-334 SS-4) TaxID=945553 RepID=A0A0D2NF38_HYPSF|nr:hypothetical protein HYPSUDRAFT_70607 [Hypholoma sublateritium FD-334 SS-4]
MVGNESPAEDEIKEINGSVDWNALRATSLQPGGFGNERVDIWPRLLHVSSSSRKPVKEEETKAHSAEESTPHSDERQISLDTDRSFVLYPAEPTIDRETLQAGLHQLLVSLFRRRPRLSYFQGYHDIASVFFLTLPEELQLPCLEKASLHRLRDSMGVGLEPVLGLLRVTKNLIGLADADYAGILEQSSPLPFFALSNLLTLFSHDMPTLPLIQHVFDYLLCRPPVASVYLAAAIILSRKQEVLRLQEEDEDGMIHSLLSSLPHLADNPADAEVDTAALGLWKDEEEKPNENSVFFKEEETAALSVPFTPSGADSTLLEVERSLHSTEPTPSEISEATTDDVQSLSHDSVVDSNTLTPIIDPLQSSSPIDPTVTVEANTPSPDPMNSGIKPNGDNTDDTKIEKLSAHPVFVHPKLTLVELLTAADALYEKFPPSDSGLALSSIMGPQSVIFTWSESASNLPSDHTAEAMVAHPELVVYPYVDVHHDQKEKSVDEGSAKARRKRRKLRKSPFGQIEKKTMLAGTVVVLGVAMAIYGMKARQSTAGHGLFYYADGHGHGAKDWKRVGGWLGGAFAGLSQKLFKGAPSGA